MKKKYSGIQAAIASKEVVMPKASKRQFYGFGIPRFPRFSERFHQLLADKLFECREAGPDHQCVFKDPILTRLI